MLFYADKVTDSMRVCMDEVHRRREVQVAWNEEHGLTPTTVIKPVRDSIEALYDMDYSGPKLPEPESGPQGEAADDPAASWDAARLRGEIVKLGEEMRHAAGELRFEDAARLRDRLKQLEELELAR